MPPRRPAGQLFGEDHRHPVVLPETPKPPKPPKAKGPGDAFVTPTPAQAAKARMQDQQKAALAAQSAINDRIFSARQARTLQQTIANRVSATAGLTPVGSLGQTGKDKDPYITQGADKRVLAKSNALRLKHGGLLTDAQRLDEYLSNEAVTKSVTPTFEDTHQLPGILSRPYVPPTEPARPGTRVAGSPRQQMTDAQHTSDNGIGDIVAGAANLASRALGTGVEAGAAAFRTGLTPMRPGLNQPHTPAESVDTSKTLPQASHDVSQSFNETIGTATKRFGELVRPAISAPHVPVPQNFLSAEARAASKGQPVYADEIGPGKRYGEFALGHTTRAAMAPQIKANGFPIQDMPQWNDADVIARYFTKNDKSVGGFARNLAADLGEQAALVTAPTMFADSIIQSIAKRSPQPLLRLGGEYAQSYGKFLPKYGDRPFWENAYEHPFTEYLTVVPASRLALRKTVGRAIAPTRTLQVPSAIRAVEAAGDHATPEMIDAAHPRVLASQDPIHRMGQGIHDYFLRHGAPPVEGQGRIPGTVAAIGNKLDERIQQGAIRQVHFQGRLVKGQEPHLAILELVQAMKNLPGMRNVLRGGRQTRLIEAIIRSHLATGTGSEQLAAAFEGKAKRSDEAALAADEDARAAREKLAKLKEHAKEVGKEASKVVVEPEPTGGEPGGGGSVAELRAPELLPRDGAIASAEQAVKDFEREAERMRGVAEQQRKLVAEVRAFPVDIKAPAKGHGELAQAARKAARMQTQMLKDSGFLDDNGILYGDWQHRIDIVRETEGPGSKFAIEQGYPNGTPAYHIAEKLMPLRDQFVAARNLINGREAADQTEMPASSDISSPEAQHQFGRVRRVGRMQQMLKGAVYELGKRQRERLSRLPAEHAKDPNGPVHHARQRAKAAGIAPSVVTRAVKRAVDTLGFERQKGREKAGRITTGADTLEAQERFKFEQDSEDTIQRLRRSLVAAQRAGASAPKIAELNRSIQEAEKAKAEGFKPSEKLLFRRARAEREGLLGSVRLLDSKQIAAVIEKNFTPQQIERIGPQVVEDAVRHALDQNSGYGKLYQDLAGMREDAHARFKQASGHSAEDALALDTLRARYGEALRKFAEDQLPRGHDPVHVRLHRPDEGYGLQPVRVAGGEQFHEANFTNDMHFWVSNDLAGLTNKAVEGYMYKELAQGPFVLEHPKPGEPVPPGFYAVPRDAWRNLQSASRHGGQLDELIKSWEQQGPSYVPHDGGETVLITKVMRDHIIDLVKRGEQKEIGLYLRAMNFYRRWMLFTVPRTYINNYIGNPLLAALQGAGLRTWRESKWTLQHHPERIANTLRLRGIAGGVGGARGARGLFGPQALWRHLNTFEEDNGNLMVYLLHAKRAFKKSTRENPEMKSLHWFNRVGRMNEHWAKFLEDAANGKNPDAALWSAKSAEMFGEMNSAWKYDRAISGGIMFHRWVAHMIFLTMWTMPMRYPGRTLFLQQTAMLADQYRKEHGLFPEWAKSMIPLWHTVDTVLGKKGAQTVTWALSGGGFLPNATYGQTFDLGDTAQPKAPLQSALASNLAPPLRIGLEQLIGRRLDTLQPFQDEYGRDIGTGWPNLGVLANSVIANTPLLNIVAQRPGLSDNTVQIPFLFPQHPRYSKVGLSNPDLAAPRAYKGLNWWEQILMRAGTAVGATIRPVDAQGERGVESANRTISYQAQQQTKRINKENEITNAKLAAMSPADQKAWIKKNAPRVYQYLYPNG